MSWTLALLLSAAPAASSGPHNLDFASGRLDGWTGEGFYLTTGSGDGPSRSFGVCSSDRGRPGHAALLYQTFKLPPYAGTIHFTAYAAGGASGDDLDVRLEAAQRQFLPKLVQTDKGYEKADGLLPPAEGRPREYVFRVSDRAGETVRLLIIDRDKAPGRYVFCGGFRVETAGAFEARQFTRHMTRLVREHRLNPLTPMVKSQHFMALGNTDAGFARAQLARCELLYDHFVHHFRLRGFRLKPPAGKMAVALFDAPKGFDAYFGQRMPSMITGIYDLRGDRLVVYDFGRNRELVKGREEARAMARQLSWDQQSRFLGAVERHSARLRNDTNVSTIMHEAAHQVSFATGVFNRRGDNPVWLMEGLATYCEATERGAWKGVGVNNPQRLGALAAAQRGDLRYLPLKTLLEGDDWLRLDDGRGAAVGYAQSWALFHMLMKEQPRELRKYCELIYTRRTPEHRLADFAEVFGSDLKRLERRHREYVKRLLKTTP